MSRHSIRDTRLLAALVAASCLAVCAAIPTPYGTESPGAALGPVVNGTATQFGGPQSASDASSGLVNGACGYGALSATEWPYQNVIGISSSNILATNASTPMPKAGCGKCVQVVCATGNPNCPPDAQPVVVLVVDSCPKCTPSQLNIDYLTFSRSIANPGVGHVSVQWQQIECKPAGAIVAKISQYRSSAGGFVALTLLEVAGSGALTSIELRSTPQNGTAGVVQALSDAAGWLNMTNTYGAVWEANLLPPLPWDLRITNAGISEQLVARRFVTAPVQPGKEFTSMVQFSTSTSPDYTGQPGSTLQQLPTSVYGNSTK